MTLPANLPTASINSVGLGWKGVAVGEKLRTGDLYWAWHTQTPTGEPGWILGSFYTSEGRTNQGFQTYKRAASLRARLSILIPVARKVLRRLVERYSAHAPLSA